MRLPFAVGDTQLFIERVLHRQRVFSDLENHIVAAQLAAVKRARTEHDAIVLAVEIIYLVLACTVEDEHVRARAANEFIFGAFFFGFIPTAVERRTVLARYDNIRLTVAEQIHRAARARAVDGLGGRNDVGGIDRNVERRRGDSQSLALAIELNILVQTVNIRIGIEGALNIRAEIKLNGGKRIDFIDRELGFLIVLKFYGDDIFFVGENDIVRKNVGACDHNLIAGIIETCVIIFIADFIFAAARRIHKHIGSDIAVEFIILITANQSRTGGIAFFRYLCSDNHWKFRRLLHAAEGY